MEFLFVVFVCCSQLHTDNGNFNDTKMEAKKKRRPQNMSDSWFLLLLTFFDLVFDLVVILLWHSACTTHSCSSHKFYFIDRCFGFTLFLQINQNETKMKYKIRCHSFWFIRSVSSISVSSKFRLIYFFPSFNFIYSFQIRFHLELFSFSWKQTLASFKCFAIKTNKRSNQRNKGRWYTRFVCKRFE